MALRLRLLRLNIGTRILPRVVGSLLLIILVQQVVHSRITLRLLSASLTGHKGNESIIQDTGVSSQLYQLYNSTEESTVNHTNETELPTWLKTYFRWHSNQLELIENSTSDDLARFRFIVLVCLNGMNCGGTADRLKSIPHFLVKANQTNRIFGIFWNNNNITLSDYYIPPKGGLDWTGGELNASSAIYRLLHANRDSCLYDPSQVNHGVAPIPSFQLDTQVVCVCARAFPEEELEFYRGSYPKVFHFMFQPSSGLLSYLESQLELMEPSTRLTLDNITLRPKEDYLAVHLRLKYPVNGPEGRTYFSFNEDHGIAAFIADNAIETVISQYIETFGRAKSRNLPAVYVASDTSQMIHYLMHDSPLLYVDAENSSLLASSGHQQRHIISLSESTRPHLNFHKGDQDELYSTFADHWMLLSSTCMVYGAGGFGAWAASLKDTSVHCQKNHQVQGNYVKHSIKAAQYWARKNLTQIFYPGADRNQ
mmetsp:Transcript_12109/g.26318  ORF Transcript_12109/g.26318 Transcript_12109/m.26318 type:complete len:481 (+) Transcript_12109:372-1814(+)